MTAADLQEYDRIMITGKAGNGKRYVRLPCTVATVSQNEPPAVKVWPDDDDSQLTPDEHRIGKLWFVFTNVEEVVLVNREVTP